MCASDPFLELQWAFVDYENIPTLEHLDLSVYDKVLVFIGAQQSSLHFGPQKYLQPVNLEVITIEHTQLNNLDFHLAFYLGKYHEICAPEIAFHVISQDNGFRYLIHHLNANGRICLQLDALPTVPRSKFIKILQTSRVKHRPKNLHALKNHIASLLNLKGNNTAIQAELDFLIKENVIKVNGNSVKYL